MYCFKRISKILKLTGNHQGEARTGLIVSGLFESHFLAKTAVFQQLAVIILILDFVYISETYMSCASIH